MEEEVASKDPGLAIIGTQRKLTQISPYVFRGEVGISIVNLITLEIEVVILLLRRETTSNAGLNEFQRRTRGNFGKVVITLLTSVYF